MLPFNRMPQRCVYAFSGNMRTTSDRPQTHRTSRRVASRSLSSELSDHGSRDTRYYYRDTRRDGRGGCWKRKRPDGESRSREPGHVIRTSTRTSVHVKSRSSSRHHSGRSTNSSDADASATGSGTRPKKPHATSTKSSRKSSVVKPATKTLTSTAPTASTSTAAAVQTVPDTSSATKLPDGKVVHSYADATKTSANKGHVPRACILAEILEKHSTFNILRVEWKPTVYPYSKENADLRQQGDNILRRRLQAPLRQLLLNPKIQEQPIDVHAPYITKACVRCNRSRLQCHDQRCSNRKLYIAIYCPYCLCECFNKNNFCHHARSCYLERLDQKKSPQPIYTAFREDAEITMVHCPVPGCDWKTHIYSIWNAHVIMHTFLKSFSKDGKRVYLGELSEWHYCPSRDQLTPPIGLLRIIGSMWTHFQNCGVLTTAEPCWAYEVPPNFPQHTRLHANARLSITLEELSPSLVNNLFFDVLHLPLHILDSMDNQEDAEQSIIAIQRVASTATAVTPATASAVTSPSLRSSDRQGAPSDVTSSITTCIMSSRPGSTVPMHTLVAAPQESPDSPAPHTEVRADFLKIAEQVLLEQGTQAVDVSPTWSCFREGNTPDYSSLSAYLCEDEGVAQEPVSDAPTVAHNTSTSQTSASHAADATEAMTMSPLPMFPLINPTMRPKAPMSSSTAQPSSMTKANKSPRFQKLVKMMSASHVYQLSTAPPASTGVTTMVDAISSIITGATSSKSALAATPKPPVVAPPPTPPRMSTRASVDTPQMMSPQDYPDLFPSPPIRIDPSKRAEDIDLECHLAAPKYATAHGVVERDVDVPMDTQELSLPVSSGSMSLIGDITTADVTTADTSLAPDDAAEAAAYEEADAALGGSTSPSHSNMNVSDLTSTPGGTAFCVKVDADTQHRPPTWVDQSSRQLLMHQDYPGQTAVPWQAVPKFCHDLRVRRSGRFGIINELPKQQRATYKGPLWRNDHHVTVGHMAIYCHPNKPAAVPGEVVVRFNSTAVRNLRGYICGRDDRVPHPFRQPGLTLSLFQVTSPFEHTGTLYILNPDKKFVYNTDLMVVLGEHNHFAIVRCL